MKNAACRLCLSADDQHLQDVLNWIDTCKKEIAEIEGRKLRASWEHADLRQLKNFLLICETEIEDLCLMVK